MLAVPPLIGCNKDEREEETDRFSIGGDDFSCGSLLDSIDFDDIFIGIGDGDVLPDLEMDSTDMFGDFSISGGEESELNVSSDHHERVDHEEKNYGGNKDDEEDYGGNCNSGSISTTSNLNSNSSSSLGDQEILSKRVDDDHEIVNKEDNIHNPTTTVKEGDVKARKSGNQPGKGVSQGKRKVKVDWTPELHRRFVQAVEQLGMDKAVPSRILEIMGIDCLTRHNIAKIPIASETFTGEGGRGGELEPEKTDIWRSKETTRAAAAPPPPQQHPHMNPWIAPTMGFPPPPPTSLQPFRPLHRFPAPPVPGIPPPQAMYKVEQQSIGVPSPPQSDFQSPFDHFQPTKESIDAAIGDVLSKPWLPLPLGLKPPSLDTVMVELQRQGIPKIPPATTASA
ncbi:hypothetical protein Scep_028214 [Stephania cephalantha]|uniref:HTH myb-type domain-containing protein n=1 Tax=Stephania cephalantha TaxID=152367 RepID=A0AAP0EE40_9MAGN